MVSNFIIMEKNTLTDYFTGFLDKVKSGKAQAASSGFGGKGLDRLDKERDAREKAERKAYGEPAGEEEKVAPAEEVAAVKAVAASTDDMTFGNFKVEIKRGPAPDSSKGLLGVGGAIAAARRLAHAKEEERIQSQVRAAEEAAARAGKDTAAHKQALSVVAKLNAQMRASKLVLQSQLQAEESGATRKTNSDSTDFHAIIPINDYPQKARWRVTNKETMVQLIDMTGASVTNKGIYYEPGKEPPIEGPPKLHLLIESNEEYRVSTYYDQVIYQFLTYFHCRSNKLFGKSRGYLLKPQLLHYRQRCAILRLRADTVFFKLQYYLFGQHSFATFITLSCFSLFHILLNHNFYQHSAYVLFKRWAKQVDEKT